MDDLIKFKEKVTSQGGEDGILLEIFKRLDISKGTCVEFGAWDGKHLSNTWNLWANNSWRSVLIEGDGGKFVDLEKEYGAWKNVVLVNKYVAVNGIDSLDNILKEVGIDENFDLLSVDIDGDDYHIWSALSLFAPKVVVIEHNPSIPPNMEIVDVPGSGFLGASATSLLKLAESKGYELVTCTKTNSFYIKEEYFSKLRIEKVHLMDVFHYDIVRYIVGSLDGRMFMTLPRDQGHIRTHGLFSLRTLLPDKCSEDHKTKLTPVFVYEISNFKNNKLFKWMISMMSKLAHIFTRSS